MVRLKIHTDAKALSVSTPRHNPVKPYEDVAEGMETSFTQHMLAEMRNSVPKETPDSPAMDYYNSLMDSERAQMMAKSDTGLGIKKVILDQIVPQNMKHYLKKPQAGYSQGMTVPSKENTHE